MQGLLALIQAASAMDTEPNNSCVTGESIDLSSGGSGATSTSTDVDAYKVSGAVHGTLMVSLLNRSNPSDDFLLELKTPSGSTVLASDSMADGLASVSLAVGAPASFCIRVTGSAGGYELISDFVGTPPGITQIQDSGGTPITSSTVGTTVKIAGDGFGGAPSGLTVRFGGARARILSATPTLLTVVIPTHASDGDIVVTSPSGTSTGYSFSVGVSTPPVGSYTEPDAGYVADVSGVSVALNRTIVGFGYDLDATETADILDDILDANRTGWTIVGELPDVNASQVEWTFASSPTETDLADLLDDLDAHAGILFVQAEESVETYDLAVPDDFDLYYDPTTAGGLAQINFEEARRLYWMSGLTSVDGVEVLVPDSGLLFGTAAWGTGQDELPADSFRLMEETSSGWTETSATGHYVALGAVTIDHGTTIAGLIAATSDRHPAWVDGAERDDPDASGIYSSFDVFDYNDDADTETDEAGEWALGSVTVVNAFGSSTDVSADFFSNFQVEDAIAETHTISPTTHQVVTISFGVPNVLLWGNDSLEGRFRELCHVRPLVIAAGQNASGSADVADANKFASLAADGCPGRSLVVGGVHAGSADADTAWVGYYGDAVGLLAPMEAFYAASADVDGSGGWTASYQAFAGTSAGTPAVASAYAILRGIIPTSVLGDAGVLQLLVSTADDVSALYSESGAQVRLNLYEAVWEALRIAGATPAVRMAPQVYVADYYEALVTVQEVDPETGAAIGSADYVDPTAEGCDGPTDVEVSPLGDVFYVLCADSDSISAWSADALGYIGSVDLEGAVDTYSEMAIGQDGVLRVGSIDSGTALVESFDTWTGTRFLEPETLSASATGRVYGASVAPDDGARFAFGVTDAAATEDDDDLVVLTPDGLGRTASDMADADFPSGTYPNTMLLRDVAWRASGADVVGEFYGTASTGSDVELGVFDGASSTATATISYCEQPLGIAMDPLDGSSLGWVACSANYYLAEVDLSSSASSYSPVTTLYTGSSSGASASYYPVFVEEAQNGAFLLYGVYRSTGASNASSAYLVDRATATGGGAVYNGSYDAVSELFTRPRGGAITPMVSIATPRPGTKIAGIKRLHVIVRDPSITTLIYSIDATEVCSDTELADGSSEDCLLDTSGWSSGEHVLTVAASGGTNGDFSFGATYHAY